MYKLRVVTASGGNHILELDDPNFDPFFLFSELVFICIRKIQEGHSSAVHIHLTDSDMNQVRYAHLWATESGRVLTQISEAE